MILTNKIFIECVILDFCLVSISRGDFVGCVGQLGNNIVAVHSQR